MTLKNKSIITYSELKIIALSFPETTEEPHFEKTSFRVKKKIFATYNQKDNTACVKLSEKNQDLFCLADKSVIYPVANKWGKQGWTIVEMNKVKNEVFTDALKTAYCKVAPQKLADLI